MTAIVAPSSATVIAGTVGMVRGPEASDKSDLGVKLVLSSASRNNERFPNSLGGQIELVQSRMRGEAASSVLYLPVPVRDKLIAMRNVGPSNGRSQNGNGNGNGHGKESDNFVFIEAQSRAEIQAA